MDFESIMSDEELLLANSVDDEARKLLEAASLQLMRYRPFYGTLLASMPVKRATEWLSTMATDGRNLYYSPEFIAGMTQERKKIVFKRIDYLQPDPKKNKELKTYIEVFYRRKTAREVCFVLQHEVRHVVADHATRGRGFDHKTYNCAADHYINTDLIIVHSKSSDIGPAWFPLGSKTKWDLDKEWGFMHYALADFRFHGMHTEEIYDILKKEGQVKLMGLKGADQHQGANGKMGTENQDRANDQSGDGEGDGQGDQEDGRLGQGDVSDALGIDVHAQPTCTSEQKQANDTVMRQAIENAVKAAGSGAPPEAREFVEEAGKPKINYLRLIRRTVERMMKEHLSYRRPARRSFGLTKALRRGGYIPRNQSVILPGKVKGKTIRCHIGFDVSGSFTDDLLAPTRREISGLCGLYEDFEVTLFCWSTKVGNLVRYTKDNFRSIKDYKIQTTGGTDVRCVFNKLDELKEPIDQVIIYTDGVFSDVSREKDWAKKYGNKTLWVIIDRGRKKEWKAPFGKVIMFDKYLK
ncbi:hypothetical protein [Salmonella phage SSBI34]|nr:hypothetical protein [Salmonella phage SSBI34]